MAGTIQASAICEVFCLSSMTVPAFDDLSAFIRTWAQLPVDEPIRADTQFELELGITGDDGGLLLQAVEKHFAIQLSTPTEGYRKTFGLGPHEYLFNSEGFPVWELLPFVPKSTVRALTVGELHEALVRRASTPEHVQNERL